MSFLKRFITVDIALKEGFFEQSGGNTISIKNHRVSCNIGDPGGISFGYLNCSIYGLSQALMNKLTGIGVIQTQNINNGIVVTAGSIDANNSIVDSGVIYTGSIQAAWANYDSQPDAMLNIVATSGLAFAMLPVNPTSFNGKVSINDVMTSIAREQGYTLVNNGIQGFIDSPYLHGNSIDKIHQLSRAGSFKYVIDDTKKQIDIMPMDGNIGGDIPLVSPSTGLVGYPTFAQNGIICKSIFNRHIKNSVNVKIESSIPSANGEFTTTDVVHSIESENPDGAGAWFTDFRAFRAV